MADVARRVGVAVSTVSYALSGRRPVSEETRQRILRAIAELGYHPNLLARGLATKRTRVIALLFPSLARGLSQVQLEFVSGAADIASRRGYALLLWTSPSDNLEILRLTREGLVEGLILMEITLRDPRVEMLQELGYPFSLIGHCQSNDGSSFVDFDFEQALRLCVQHLADLGHRQIAFLSYSPVALESAYGPAVRSLEGFQAAIQAGALQGVAAVCGSLPEAGYETMRSLLAEHPALSAVIIAHDNQYPGVIQALRENNLRIPDDFSIVAIIPPRIAEMTSPALTSIDFPAVEMGRIGTDLLIRRLEGDETQPTQLLLPARLTIRHSSGPCRR
jgi:DNA-binding LacI/PurR family transcriptional regulator